MYRFKTIGTTILHAGVVELTRGQALHRERSLRHIDANRYEIVGEIQFKAGEEIGFKGEVNKSLLQSIEPEEVSGEVAPPPRRGRPKK
jgi:hypothetical protein